MSRSGYSDDIDQWDLIRWRGAVASALRGKRGQAFLKEMLAALDAMPEKKLIKYELKSETGGVCALGSVAIARGLDVSAIDESEPIDVGAAFGIPQALAAEITYLNDEAYSYSYIGIEDKDERRWKSIREWVVNQIKENQ